MLHTIFFLRFFRFAVHIDFEIIAPCKIFGYADFITGHILSAQSLENRCGDLLVPLNEKRIFRLSDFLGNLPLLGCQKLLFHCCHNVTRQQLDEGISYLGLMEQNLNTLREALG